MMASAIRHPRVDEFEALMRYVERAFGHSKGFFPRAYPHLYQPTEEAMEWAYVIDEGGEIVSHVGVYPIETVTAGVHFRIGGVGAVSTSPRARGKGYMTQLLTHIVADMRRLGYPVSWLGGDRQRYNTFGWEMASPVYDLSFTQRSLKWYGIAPVEMNEVFPDEALATIERCQSQQACHTLRPYLGTQLQKMDLRFWVSEEGYAILEGQARHHLRILELVSKSGNELGMIRALLDWNFGERANWSLSMWDRVRLGRLMQYASYWSGGNSAMYRVNDLTQVLVGARTFLSERAGGLRDFAIALGIVEVDRTTVTTLSVEDGMVQIQPGRHASTYVELPAVEATRLVFGGPPISCQSELPQPLLALLPVPCYVMPLDHV
jgi:predicted N-acetyltransferase YhbS